MMFADPQLTAEKRVPPATGVRRVIAGLMTGPGTNTYLPGLREVAVLGLWRPGHGLRPSS